MSLMKMEDSEKKYTLTLTVNNIQKDVIEQFLRDMDWENVITGVVEDLPRKKRKQTYTENILPVSESVASIASHMHLDTDENIHVHVSGNSEERNSEDQSKDITDRCPYCFISPCIAIANRAARWIGFGQVACIENSSIRKRIYKRFWKIMANNGGWHIPEYIEKKLRIGGGDWVLTHRRELMPECVVSLARQLYPNPKDIAYMDHMWE